jgi:hypothetical protein
MLLFRDCTIVSDNIYHEARTSNLKHFLCALNCRLAHVHHASSYPLSIRQLELRFGMVRVLHHADELWLLHLIKGLVAGDNPLCEETPKLCSVERFLKGHI